MKARAQVTLYGNVKGVFFRSFIRSQAKLLSLRGWVRNTKTDSVEAVFEGDKDQIQEMIDSCQEGPPGARVGDVKVEWGDYSGNFATFDIR
ncbi:MAG: acylphosphatase [Candidatus Aenigmarchaeota archaeon]|nr:acylphosphatase [Candidatus Aenigmarchaeota archaeon]